MSGSRENMGRQEHVAAGDAGGDSGYCMEGTSSSQEQTAALGGVVARHARAGDLVALYGELGAGKTQFVRGMAQEIGMKDTAIASPTFVMMQEYPAPAPGRPALVHVDAYRLKSVEDLESVGWPTDGVLNAAEFRRDAVVVVEWADRLGAMLGEDRLDVWIDHVSPTRRRLRMEPQGGWRSRWPALEADLKRVLPAEAAALPEPEATAAKCPICSKAVDADEPARPFCCDRCKMIDLGKWLGGRYVISRPVEQRDLEEG